VVDVRRIAGVLEVADAVREIVEHGGGSVSGVRPDAVRFLATFINNHTTLRAKAKRPELYHVLVRGNTILGKRALLAETFDDSTVQLEGIRGPEGPCLMARILAPHRSDAPGARRNGSPARRGPVGGQPTQLAGARRHAAPVGRRRSL
jgi:hypothetical protein